MTEPKTHDQLAAESRRAASHKMLPIMKFFAFEHLPKRLWPVAEPFHALANTVVRVARSNAEQAVALRKLLESRDAAIRAILGEDV